MWLPVGAELRAFEKAEPADRVNGPVASFDLDDRAIAFRQRPLPDDGIEHFAPARLVLAPDAEVARHGLAHQNTRAGIGSHREPHGRRRVRLRRRKHLALVAIAQHAPDERKRRRPAHEVHAAELARVRRIDAALTHSVENVFQKRERALDERLARVVHARHVERDGIEAREHGSEIDDELPARSGERLLCLAARFEQPRSHDGVRRAK